jgi:hypothetical protein
MPKYKLKIYVSYVDTNGVTITDILEHPEYEVEGWIMGTMSARASSHIKKIKDDLTTYYLKDMTTEFNQFVNNYGKVLCSVYGFRDYFLTIFNELFILYDASLLSQHTLDIQIEEEMGG